MAVGYVVRKNQYYDSVFLMAVNNRLSQFEGVEQTAILMGSENNKKILDDIGIHGEKIKSASPNDLIFGVIAETQQVVDIVLGKLDEALIALVVDIKPSQLHTLEDALAKKSSANLAVLSIPGQYVYHEATKALESGLNVFIFSSNVSIEDERKLKKIASEKNLILMGPDCGTSIIGGVGIGFSNSVRSGVVGAVGPSGTGLQEFASQIHNAGLGISHAIGTGGRDLRNEIGGITTLRALEMLEADPATELIAIIAKPPDQEILDLLLFSTRKFTKPIIGCFLGAPVKSTSKVENITWTRTIDDAVLWALQIQQGSSLPAPALQISMEEVEFAKRLKRDWSSNQKYVRGLFAGGTFCYQAQQIFGDAGIEVRSNAPIDSEKKLANPNESYQHSFVDLGAETFTIGRPHPMIDGSIRRSRILSECNDSSVGALLLDFVFGFNASMDPVGDVLDAIIEGKKNVAENGGKLTVVASMSGTDGDPQDLELQWKLLEDAGVVIFNSNAKAVMFCLELLSDGKEAKSARKRK